MKYEQVDHALTFLTKPGEWVEFEKVRESQSF